MNPILTIKKIYDTIKYKRKMKKIYEEYDIANEMCRRARYSHICDKNCEDCAWGRIQERDEKEILG